MLKKLVFLILACTPAFAQNPSLFQPVFFAKTAGAPSFSPTPGSYSSTQSVTIADTTGGTPCSSYIYYNTTNAQSGGNLTGTTNYTGAISVSTTTTYYAQIQGCPGYGNSSITTGAYTIVACNPPATNAANDWTPVSNAGGTGNPGMTDSVGSNTASQSTALLAPTYSATGGPNSTPQLTFASASSQTLQLASTIPTSWTTWSGFVVFKANTAGSTQRLLGETGANGWSVNTSGVNFEIDVGGGTPIDLLGALTNGVEYTIIWQWNFSTGAYTVWSASGGTATSIGTGTDVQTPSSTPIGWIGSAQNLVYYLNTSMSEAALYNGTISQSNVAYYSNCHFGI